ncbi:MAG: hypothetical protein WC350_02130 [Candidatus Micrarchaeia archaeon]
MNIDATLQESLRKQKNEYYVDEQGADAHLKQSARRDALDFANMHGVALKSKADAEQLFAYMRTARTTEKMLKKVAKKFDKATHERALALSRQHLFLTQTEAEAYELFLQADCALRGDMSMHVFHVSHAPSARFSDPVVAAVRQRYFANGVPIPRATLMQWFMEEKQYQKDPFLFVMKALGREVQFTVPAGDGTGNLSAEEQKARFAAITMHKLSAEGNMPPELMHLSRLEQAHAFFADARYSRLVSSATPKTAEKAAAAAPTAPEAEAEPRQSEPSSGFLKAKELIGKAADEFRKARDDRLKAEEARAIKSAFPALMGMLRKSLSAAMGKDVSAEEATELIVDGPKNKDGFATGRKGLLEMFEAYQPMAIQMADMLAIAVGKEKAKLEAKRTNKYPEKKAGLDAWEMVKQMPSVLADVNSRFGASNKAQRTDMDSAVAQEDAINHVRGHPSEVETPGQAMELFTRLRWERQVERRVGHRITDRLIPYDLSQKLKEALLQDEKLRAQKGFASVDEEIAWHVSFFSKKGAGYPVQLVAHMRHNEGVITPKVYDDVMRRLAVENPAISNEAELFDFIRRSWKVKAVERVSFLTSNGLLSTPAGERALKSMLADEELAKKGDFLTPNEELARYGDACRELNEPYPAKLVLHLWQEGGRITQEVHGAALMRIIQEKLAFKDGDEFGRFVEVVREHVASPDFADRKGYNGAFGATVMAPAVTDDSGLLAVRGRGSMPCPAPNPAKPAADKAGAGPAADAAKAAVAEPERTRTEKIEPLKDTAEQDVPIDLVAARLKAAGTPEGAPAAPQAFAVPAAPPSVDMDTFKTTLHRAPVLPAPPAASAQPETVAKPGTAAQPASTEALPTLESAVPPEVIAASASLHTDMPPLLREFVDRVDEARTAGTLAFTVHEEPKDDLPGFEPELPEGAPEVAATAADPEAEAAEGEEGERETIYGAPPEELVAQAAGETGERPTLFSEAPKDLLEAAAVPQPETAEPVLAPLPAKPEMDEYTSRLASTLFSGKPLAKRVGAAVLLTDEATGTYVPVLLRAYCQQGDMQPKAITLLAEKPADEILPSAFAYRDSLAKSGVLDLPLNELAEKYGESALPAMLGYVAKHRNAGTLEDSDAALALSMANVAGIKDQELLAVLLPAMDSLGPEVRKGIANFARTVGRDSLQPILAHMGANPGMNPDSAVALAKAAQDKAGNDAAPVLVCLLPMMGRMDQDQKSSVGVLAAKFGGSAIDHVIAYGASKAMDNESAAVLSKAVESIEEPRGREFLRHVLPMLEHMDDSQRGRVDDLAARYDCSDMILAYASEAGDKLGVEQALALARPLAQINEVHGTDDGVVFLPRMLRLADQMDDSQADLVKGYAVRFRGGAEGRDSVTSIQAFVAARGADLSAREAAVCASALAHINTDSSFKALGELLAGITIIAIHDAVKEELSGEYGLEPVRDVMVRAAIREKGALGPLGTLAFEIISEQEEEVAAGKDAEGKPRGPSADIIKGCVTQHLTTEVDMGDNIGRIAEAREFLVKFGDYAIDPLWSVALSPDFSLYPEGHRTNVLRTIAHIAEKSTSDATKQKARECIMEAVKNTDLSPGVVGSAMKVMETNVIASLRRLIYLQQKDNSRDACIKFEQRVCAILAAMGEAGHKQILEALNSRDVEEKLAGATMQGLILMHNPAITDALASDRKKPEAEMKFPVFQSVLRKLIGMLRDPEAQEEKESVAMVAYGALSAASPALPAGDLAAIISYQARDGEENLAPEQDFWSRSMAAGLLVNAEGGAATLETLIKHEPLAPEVRLQVISASTAFGASLLSTIVGYARGKGMEEKYVAVNAALAPKSPFAPLLRDMAADVEDWRQKLPAAGIEPGKPVEQWQQDVLRWAVVRGLVLGESAAANAASAAHSLAYELGMMTMPEFAKDLRAALDARAKHDGMLPDAAANARESCLDHLVAAGFKKDTLGEVLGLKDKYRAFVRRAAKNRPTSQPPQPAQQVPRAEGNGVTNK